MKKIKLLLALTLVFSFVLSVMPLAFADGLVEPELILAEPDGDVEGVEENAEEVEEVVEAVVYEALAYTEVQTLTSSGLCINAGIEIQSDAPGAVSLNRRMAGDIQWALYTNSANRFAQISVVFNVTDNDRVAKIEGAFSVIGGYFAQDFVYYYDKEIEAEITLAEYEEIIAAQAAEEVIDIVEEEVEEVEEVEIIIEVIEEIEETEE